MQKYFKILIETSNINLDKTIEIRYIYPDLKGERKDNVFTTKKEAIDFIKRSSALRYCTVIISEIYGCM